MRTRIPVIFALLLAVAAAPHVVAQNASRVASHAIDAAGMDQKVQPGDDFFRYANGTWLQKTEIPPDRSGWGIVYELSDKAGLETRALLEAAMKSSSNPDAKKAGMYYAAYMDEAAIEKRGLASLKPGLDQIAAIKDRGGLAALFGASLRADVDPLNATSFHTDRLFGLFVAQDFNDPAHNAAYLLQGGIGMPDREYYVAQDAHMADVRKKYAEHVLAVLKLAGTPGAEAQAMRILDLETKIARVHATRQDSADVAKGNHPWARADFDRKAPGLDWTAFFKAAGLADQARIIVWHPGAVTGEAKLVASEPLDTWKEYLRFRTLDHWSGLLPKAYVDERFSFYSRTLSGTPQITDRWKRAMASTNASMGDAVGRLYVQKYFPPAAKARLEGMVSDIKVAFSRRIDNLKWMSPQTRARAKQKLQTLIVGVGYPDTWRSYAALQITPDDPLTNAMRAEQYEYQWQIGKLHRPIDRKEWWMTPQTINAVNLPIQNALNFPAAYLQPPYYDPEADAAINFGAVGATIGHEISHSFDDQGSQFDASGKMVNWWTPADFAHFKEASTKLVQQYNTYEPVPGLHVNGQQTLSENIADVAGLSAAYDAYKASLKGKPATIQAGLSGDQRFFLAFAQSWRTKYREALLRQITITDGHAPDEFRADTVRNLDAWYDAFRVQPGQKLFLAPGDRVRVW